VLYGSGGFKLDEVGLEDERRYLWENQRYCKDQGRNRQG
jgi:hypothetical protein